MNSICMYCIVLILMIQFLIVRTREKEINRGSIRMVTWSRHKGGGGRAEASTWSHGRVTRAEASAWSHVTILLNNHIRGQKSR